MRILILSTYFLMTLPIVTVWGASSIMSVPGEPLLFQPACDEGGLLAQSLLRGFCSNGGAAEVVPAGGCLSAKTHDDLAVILNEIAEKRLAADYVDLRVAELGTDGCAPTGAGDTLRDAYVDLRDGLLGL